MPYEVSHYWILIEDLTVQKGYQALLGMKQKKWFKQAKKKKKKRSKDFEEITYPVTTSTEAQAEETSSKKEKLDEYKHENNGSKEVAHLSLQTNEDSPKKKKKKKRKERHAIEDDS